MWLKKNECTFFAVDQQPATFMELGIGFSIGWGGGGFGHCLDTAHTQTKLCLLA